MPERSRPPTGIKTLVIASFFTPELKSAIYVPKLEYKYPRAPNSLTWNTLPVANADNWF